MHIIFSHGRSGHPNGKKIQCLSTIAKQQGWQCQSLDYTDTQDPEQRAARLTNVVLQQQQPFCLVGSSMGGYASLVAAEKANHDLLIGVFLMAPAIYLPRYQQQQFTTLNHVEIVHGWHDETVLYEHAVRYAREKHCTLHLIHDNHRLSEQPNILSQLFTQFLINAKARYPS